jgi:sigma-E factor negative regulatory protein RseB
VSLLAGLRRQGWQWLVCLPLGLAPMAQASEAASGAASLAEARVWLTRIHNAAVSANYQGTMVFSSVGGVLSSSRVWHFFAGEQTYERLDALDGRQQHIVRHNDTVHTLWPQSRVAVLERRETLAAWSTTPQSVDPQALEQYELRREGLTRVAGREAVVLLLEPRESLRYAQRLWADLVSGLMLRADVLGPANGAMRGVLESTAFSEVDIGVQPQPELVLQVMRRLEGYRVLRPQQQRTTLEAEGWVLARPVAGFRHAGCMRRSMEGAGREGPVLQSVFSDGLTHVSLFVEPYKAEHHRNEMRAQQGATATLMQRRGEYWVTVVGDVPPATLKLFAEALERRR